MSVVTRFAPSPTGFLHIGSARTALFNWLYARHTGGSFLLRVEDTDQKRSTPEAIQAIFDSLAWLGIDADQPPIFQSKQAARHQEVAQTLLDAGKAYRCYCTQEDLQTMREEARTKGRAPKYNGLWRDRSPSEAPANTPSVIRFKRPLEGEILLADHVQGDVRIQPDQLDDLVLLRADGSPTYMLSVVVDDHDMGITHVIRGNDHLTNAFRQAQIYKALGWQLPAFAHVPLIHGPDGAKLSKRHGALGAEAYRDMGFFPEAMRNYLLRLGWSHGDDEIISTKQAIEWFNLKSIGRSPARFDVNKLTHLNAHYLKETPDAELAALIQTGLEHRYGNALSEETLKTLAKGMAGLKTRSKTLKDLQDAAYFYVDLPPYTEKALKFIIPENGALLLKIQELFSEMAFFDEPTIEAELRQLATSLDIKLGAIAQPLRIALTGSVVSPSLFELIPILGKDLVLSRLKTFADHC